MHAMDSNTYDNNNQNTPSSEEPSYQKITHKKYTDISIISWNIQSRNSTEGNKFLDNNFLSNIANFDIVCLQETKAPINLNNYRAFNSNRTDSVSGGVSILYKTEFSKGISQFHTKITPDVVIAKLSKNYFNTKFDVYVVSFYISPSNSSYLKRKSHDPWDDLDEVLGKLKDKGEVILCGDANARIGTNADYLIDTDRNFYDLPFEFASSHSTPRNNTDSITNSYCNDLLDLVISNNLKSLNGRTRGDLFGKKTHFSRKGTSLIDYIIVSTSLIDNILEFRPQNFTIYSDHRPLLARVKFEAQFSSELVEYSFQKLPNRFKWVIDSNAAFRNALNSENISSKFQEILKTSPNDSTHLHSENINSIFIETIIEAARCSLAMTKTPKKLPHKKWFGRDCFAARRNLNRTARRMKYHYEYAKVRNDFFDAKREYRRIIDSSKRKYRSNLNKSIENGKIVDWSNFKQLKQEYDEPEQFDSHDLATFYEFFNSLYKKTQVSTTHDTPNVNAECLHDSDKEELCDSLTELNK